MKSLSEIETVSKRSTRSMGFPWGILITCPEVFLKIIRVPVVRCVAVLLLVQCLVPCWCRTCSRRRWRAPPTQVKLILRLIFSFGTNLISLADQVTQHDGAVDPEDVRQATQQCHLRAVQQQPLSSPT